MRRRSASKAGQPEAKSTPRNCSRPLNPCGLKLVGRLHLKCSRIFSSLRSIRSRVSLTSSTSSVSAPHDRQVPPILFKGLPASSAISTGIPTYSMAACRPSQKAPRFSSNTITRWRSSSSPTYATSPITMYFDWSLVSFTSKK